MVTVGVWFATKGYVVDDSTLGPGLHENSALDAVGDKTEEAKVYALLAIASSINRLANAIENYTASQS